MKNELIKKRIEWIDIAKGMTITLVVYGHIALAGIPMLHKYFGSFRMPFFFIVSGILFSIKRYNTLGDFLKKRSKTLLLPYIYCSLIVLVSYSLMGKWNLLEKSKDVLINGWGGYALWFIPILYCCELGYYIIRKYVEKFTPIILFVMLVIGYVLSYYNIKSVYSFTLIPVAIFYYGIGNLYGGKIKRNKFNYTKVVIYCVLSMLASLSIFLSNSTIEYAVNKLGGIYGLIASVTGSAAMILLAIVISKSLPQFIKNIPVFLGKNSYAVLAFHQLLINTMTFFFDLPGYMIRLLMWMNLVLVIILINKYIPFLFSKK